MARVGCGHHHSRRGTDRTTQAGYARVYRPATDVFALVVRGSGREEVLYEEQLEPGETYVYRPDSSASSGRIFILTTE